MLTFEEMPQLRFGIEIEILIPNGKMDGFDFKSIADKLTNLGSTPILVCCGLGEGGGESPPSKRQRLASSGGKIYEYYSRHQQQTSNNRDWKLVRDASLTVESPHDLCFELVSPVLQGEEGLVELRLLMENLRRLGIATNHSCSFHVHVDATGEDDDQQAVAAMGTLRGIQNVAGCFLALESAFDLLVGLSWDKNEHHRRADQNKYCRSNRLNLGPVSNRQRWDRISTTLNFTHLVNVVSPNRYHKLNLQNIIDRQRPSTCEFRGHGGVENLEEAEAWVRLLLRFCQQASSLDSISQCCLLPQGANPKDELRAMFQLLDCAGLEQYFFVERRLFSEDRMQNLWTCKVCRKVFQDSRALSQHCAATRHHCR